MAEAVLARRRGRRGVTAKSSELRFFRFEVDMIAFFGTDACTADEPSTPPMRAVKRPAYSPSAASPTAKTKALSTVVLTPVENVGRMRLLLSGMRSYLWSGLTGRR